MEVIRREGHRIGLPSHPFHVFPGYSLDDSYRCKDLPPLNYSIKFKSHTIKHTGAYFKDWIYSLDSASGFVSSYLKIVCLFSLATPSFSNANYHHTKKHKLDILNVDVVEIDLSYREVHIH